MKGSGKSLERLMKRIVKGGDVNAEEVLFHWRQMGNEANRIIIEILTRQQGWASFTEWADRNTETKGLLESIAFMAGVPEEAEIIFQQHHLSFSAGDTPRGRAQEILRSIQQEVHWQRSFDMLRANEDLLAGTLILIEHRAPASAAKFLTALLKTGVSKQQDQLIRKTLYRLKQKGIEAEKKPGVKFGERQYFAFGKNSLPLWQPIFYFRAHSLFSSTGNLYILQLTEGEFFEKTTRANAVLDRKGLLDLCQDYSDHLWKEAGLKISFILLPDSHARYFLQRSFRLLPETERQKMEDFLKSLGEGESEDPFASFEYRSEVSDEAGTLFRNLYFKDWMIPLEDMATFFEELKKIQEGPIILPESQIRLRRQKVIQEGLLRYFDAHHREVWSLAFEKAAYYLQATDSPDTYRSLTIARRFLDPELVVEQFPAVLYLFQNTMDFAKEKEKRKQKEEKRTSLIVSPGSFLDQP